MSNLETRSLLDEFRGFDRGGFFELGHPLLNRIAGSFLKAAGIGAVPAVSTEAYFTAIEGSGLDSSNMSEFSGTKKYSSSHIKGEEHRKRILAVGLAAGVYSGLTYGLKEARGAHDWKNSAMAGAMTGVALAFTSEDSSHEQIVQCAIT